MSQPYRPVQLPVIGAVLLGLLLGVYVFASRRLTKKSAVVKHRVKTQPGEALKYWTREKKDEAKPAPMPHVDAADRGKQDPHSPRV